ncbi:MAG: site-specific integrase, partial [Pseudomonadota bacterium]
GGQASVEAIWYDKPKAAYRVRQRSAQALDSAAADGFCSDANPVPAAMAGLAKAKQVRVHHAAMPHSEIPKLLQTTFATDVHPLSKLALEFIVLTAARTSEVLKAEWAEVDIEASVWNVPSDRMKAGRLHEVPLAERACCIGRGTSAIRKCQSYLPAQASRQAILKHGFSDCAKAHGNSVHGTRYPIIVSRMGSREDHISARNC